MCRPLQVGKRAVEIRNQMDVNTGSIPALSPDQVANLSNAFSPYASVATPTGVRLRPNAAYARGGAIHERNDEGKPSATYVSGKPGSVLPRELLVHLQKLDGEERDKAVLKVVEAAGKKPIPASGESLISREALTAQMMATMPVSPFNSPVPWGGGPGDL